MVQSGFFSASHDLGKLVGRDTQAPSWRRGHIEASMALEMFTTARNAGPSSDYHLG